MIHKFKLLILIHRENYCFCFFLHFIHLYHFYLTTHRVLCIQMFVCMNQMTLVLHTSVYHTVNFEKGWNFTMFIVMYI